MPAGFFTLFVNGSYCLNGELVEDHLVASEDTGLILKRAGYIGGEIVDLEDGIIAPGFLELQTNGVHGFHFTHFEDNQQYDQKLEETAKYYVTEGVTSFWATIPTVSSNAFQKVLDIRSLFIIFDSVNENLLSSLATYLSASDCSRNAVTLRDHEQAIIDGYRCVIS